MASLTTTSFVVGRQPIPVSVRRRVLLRDEIRCQYCGADAETIDHIVPVAFGGSNLEANRVAACRYCNQKASDKVFDSFEEK